MAIHEKFLAKTLKGLEPLLDKELKELGAERTRVVNRGVEFWGGRSLMYKVNLASRLALRVLVPIHHMEVTDAEMLYSKVKRFDWSMYLDNRMTFAIDPVIHSPHFRNSQFAALRVKDAIADRFRDKTSLRPSVRRKDPDLLINLHISGSKATLSLDSSGGSLHKRGYRLAPFEAPLNEVLAAGMVMMTGWKGQVPLMDPMCGSGTLVIEAAMIAAGIPPGIFRTGYGFENWKEFDRELLEQVIGNLGKEHEVAVPILARDADPVAVDLTRRQLERMELSHLVSVEVGDFFESEEAGREMVLIMNPPYGERMDPGHLEETYKRIGSTLKHRFPDSNAWILTSNRKALTQVGLKPSEKRILYNGSLECSFVRFETFKGTWKDHKTLDRQ